MQYRVLMADSDSHYSGSVSRFFQKSGLAIVCTGDGDAALRLFGEERFDLILLDVMLSGGIDGFYVAEKIRGKDAEVPIIFVTARTGLEDVQRGFGRCRADDYIAKPYDEQVLLLKTLALIERSKGYFNVGRVLTSGGIMLIPSTREVWVNHEAVSLTPKLFDLLAILMEREGRVLSRQELLDLVWGYEFFGDSRVVDTHMTKLRHALGGEAARIQTIHRIGYKLRVDDHQEGTAA